MRVCGRGVTWTGKDHACGYQRVTKDRLRTLEAAERRPVSLDDLTEMDRRRLMHERIRAAEAECERLRVEVVEWREEAHALRRQLRQSGGGS